MPEVDEIDDKTAAVFKRKGYKVLKPLGAGNFGTVFKAEFVKTGVFAAVKVMNLDRVDKLFKNKFLPREMAAMIESNHKHVIKLYDIFRSNKKLYIFMEFAGNGDIMGVLRKHGVLSIAKANIWFRQASEGLEYLHNTLKISHRDIKVDNILLDEQNNAKISDFGFAKKSYDQEKDEVVLSSTFCGTMPYQCPEIVKREPYDPYKADVWAMGISLFAMLNDKFVYHCGDTFQTNKEMENPDYLEKRYTKEFCRHVKRLIRNMLAYKQDDRYTAKEVLESKWVAERAKCCESNS